MHHRTYERLGAERDADLEVLCVACHEGEHVTQLAQSESRIYLKLASDALRALPFATIGDLTEATKQRCADHRIPYHGPEVHRAIELLTATRLTPKSISKPIAQSDGDRGPISPQDAREILARLNLGSIVRTMPADGQTPAEQAAHEEQVRAQVAALRRQDDRRPSLRARLEAVFA